jgi:hypothetical protein
MQEEQGLSNAMSSACALFTARTDGGMCFDHAPGQAVHPL